MLRLVDPQKLETMKHSTSACFVETLCHQQGFADGLNAVLSLTLPSAEMQNAYELGYDRGVVARKELAVARKELAHG